MKTQKITDVNEFSRILWKIKSKNLYYIEKRVYKIASKSNLNWGTISFIEDVLDSLEEKLNQKLKYKKLKKYLNDIDC